MYFYLFSIYFLHNSTYIYLIRFPVLVHFELLSQVNFPKEWKQKKTPNLGHSNTNKMPL